MLRYICALLLFFLTSINVSACSMRDFWLHMPDTITPYLDLKLRSELVDYSRMGVQAVVKNKYGELTLIDTFINDFMQLKLSSSSTLQIKRLPSNLGDSLFCVIKTFGDDVKESDVALFNEKWEKVCDVDLYALITIPNDSLSPRHVNNSLKDYHIVPLASATLSPRNDDLSIKMLYAFSFCEDKDKKNNCLVQKVVKWNGENFK